MKVLNFDKFRRIVGTPCGRQGRANSEKSEDAKPQDLTVAFSVGHSSLNAERPKVGWVAEKTMKSRYWLIVCSLLFVLTIGKGMTWARIHFLPDFSFILEEDNFDPRDVSGRAPLNLAEAKSNLRQIFYSGLAEALRNRNLPIISETLRQIEKVLDLASKVFRLPLTTYHLPLTLAIPPPLKDFFEKLLRLMNQATTFPITYHLLPITSILHLTLYTFLFITLLSLSKIVLRL